MGRHWSEGVEVWQIAYGCVFLAQNTGVAILPVWFLTKQFGERTAVIAVGVALGMAASFVLGGCWYVLLPELWSSPRPTGFNRWGWFVISGGFSVAFASAGWAVVAAVAGLVWLARRHIG